jgi:hypothetical protein
MTKLKASFVKKFTEARKNTSIACLPDVGLSEKVILDKVAVYA